MAGLLTADKGRIVQLRLAKLASCCDCNDGDEERTSLCNNSMCDTAAPSYFQQRPPCHCAEAPAAAAAAVPEIVFTVSMASMFGHASGIAATEDDAPKQCIRCFQRLWNCAAATALFAAALPTGSGRLCPTVCCRQCLRMTIVQHPSLRCFRIYYPASVGGPLHRSGCWDAGSILITGGCQHICVFTCSSPPPPPPPLLLQFNAMVSVRNFVYWFDRRLA
jgi:hypothetical protein